MVNDVPRLHIEIPDELHRRAKIAAVQRGETLKGLVIEAVERLVTEQEQQENKSRGQQ